MHKKTSNSPDTEIEFEKLKAGIQNCLQFVILYNLFITQACLSWYITGVFVA